MSFVNTRTSNSHVQHRMISIRQVLYDSDSIRTTDSLRHCFSYMKIVQQRGCIGAEVAAGQRAEDNEEYSYVGKEGYC